MNLQSSLLICLFISLFCTPYFYAAAAKRSLEQDGFNDSAMRPPTHCAFSFLRELKGFAQNPTPGKKPNLAKHLQEIVASYPKGHNFERMRVDRTQTELFFNQTTGDIYCLAAKKLLISGEELTARRPSRTHIATFLKTLKSQGLETIDLFQPDSWSAYSQLVAAVVNYPRIGSLSLVLLPDWTSK